MIGNKRQALKGVAVLLTALFLIAGCGDKTKKETLWETWQEPIAASPLPADSGAREIRSMWKQSVGKGAESGFALLKPARYQDSVYVAARNGEVYRIEADSGDVLWKIDTGAPVYAAAGASDGIVVVGHDNGDVSALRTADGEIVWRSGIKRQISAIPVVGEGRVVVRTADGFVIGLDSGSGDIEWQIKKAVPGLSMHGDSTPLISGDVVLVGLSSGKLIANNVISGRDYWEMDISWIRGRNEIERLGDADTPPIILGNTVYAGNYQGSVVAVQLADARLIWRKDISTRLPMAIANGLLVVIGELGQVIALDAASGDTLWQQTAFQGHGVSQPIIVGNRIIIGDRNGNVHTLDTENGSLIETRRVVSGAIVGIVQDGDQFTVYSSKGNLSTLSL